MPSSIRSRKSITKLTPGEFRNYHERGYSFPHRALSLEEAESYRKKLENYEDRNGLIMKSPYSNKPHLVFTWVHELIHNPRILSLAESVLGPNLLVWGTNFWIKEPNDPAYVSWHQDSTYWGLSTPDVMTIWVALSTSNKENGVMRVLANTHKRDQMVHDDTFAADNLLSRGQEVQIKVDDSEVVDMELEPGEVSLHHVKLVHGSNANSSNSRRIGLAIRMIPTHVKQTVGPKDFATLVSGEDRFNHFEYERAPERDLGEQEIKEHERINEINKKILYRGANYSVGEMKK
ncbi:MAG: phytanoyl-CoA dioxygenase [Proteobacteria bacterium]|nr:phytanoyl-CoA dioxygenase [Pseudomonadota bacterium]